jgi:hypothetical protein
MTLLVGGAAAGFDNCPLCGQKLAPAQAEQTKTRMQKVATSGSSDDLILSTSFPQETNKGE